MTKTGIIAVLTGDLVDSSSYSQPHMDAIIQRLNLEFKTIVDDSSANSLNFSMFRGDSFQGITENLSSALVLALRIKALVNSYSEEGNGRNKTPITDIRISIGIGEGHYDTKTIHISNGEAFQLSGRILDEMKAKNETIRLTTSVSEVNEEFLVHMRMLDSLISRWSISSAEVVYFLLNNYKERAIADKLNRSQAAINLRKKASGWEEIKILLNRYERVIKKYFP